jgi:hypothetical protein
VRRLGLLPRMRSTRFRTRGPCRNRSRRKRMIFSLQQRGGSKPNKYHSSQQSPNQNNRLPWDENQKSHNNNSDDERRQQLNHYKSEAPRQLGFLAVLSAMLRVRKRSFQIGR